MMSSKTSKRGILERSYVLHSESKDAYPNPNTELGAEVNQSDQGSHVWNSQEVGNMSLTSASVDNLETREHKKKSKPDEQDHVFVRTSQLQDSSARDTPDLCQAHVNPAFQDDDGAVSGSSRYPVTNRDRDQADVLENISQRDVVHVESAAVVSDIQERNVARGTTVDIVSETNENGIKQHLKTTVKVGSELLSKSGSELLRQSGIMESSSNEHDFVDNVKVVSLTQARRPEQSKLARPHSRSISSVTMHPSTSDLTSQSLTLTLQRSYSMRVSSSSNHVQPKAKARTLLRELTFSDTDAMTARNYGALRAGEFIPRREQLRQLESDADSREDILLKKIPQLESHLLNLMQELLCRGKVRQVAVLAQKSGSMLASLPPWKLSHQDQIGLVKATTCSTEIMLKITVEHKTYTIFKHAADKIMGRSGDSILVADKTHLCVVVGVAEDNIPGSCLYEVSELARALKDKGW